MLKKAEVKTPSIIEPTIGSPEYKIKYPHGKYEGADYHKPEKTAKPNGKAQKYSKPIKSPGPKDG